MTLSINGLGSALPDPIGTRSDEPADSGRPPLSEGRAQAAAAGSFVRSAETPSASGVDPELWSLLSTEERTWYLRGAISGPATYDPRSAASSGPEQMARLGARLDVRA